MVQADAQAGGRPLINSLQGVVASAHPLASAAGAGVLGEGGTAFDAAVAVAAALNVVEPFMSGLAGMGFATVWVAAERRVRVLDFVPSIPLSFPAGRFSERSELARGPLAVGPPANLAGWCGLRDAYGTMPLSRLLAPAIRLAEQGFGAGRFGAADFTQHVPGLAAMPGWGPAFGANYPYASGLEPGGIVRQAALAGTLRQIAEEGPGALYGGTLGRRIVDTVASLGGTLTMDDLMRVEAVWREPISIAYQGLKIHVPPPPCEGFQFLLTLRILEGFDVAALERNSAAHLDLVIRATRLAAGVRLADNAPSAERLATVLSDAAVEALRARLRDGGGGEGATEQWIPTAVADPGHTTSFSIGDAAGNLVCVTQSLGMAFGSGVVPPGTGVCLNNFLYWADVQPGSPNRAVPGGPLAMCMSPSISTRDGLAALALGTPGSYGILQTQAQAMLSHLAFGLPLQEAIEAPRMRLWDGRLVEVEDRIAPEVIASLCEMGHEARVFPTAWAMRVGGMQAVARNAATGLLTGAADPRRDGYAVAVS